MSSRDDIKAIVHTHGYGIIVEDAVDQSKPIDFNIESMYKAMDALISVLIDDMAECIHSLAVQLNMPNTHTNAECDLMEEIVISTRMIKFIVDSGINEPKGLVQRLSSALDLSHIVFGILDKAHDMELYGKYEQFVVDGVLVLDDASDLQSDLLTEKLREGS